MQQALTPAHSKRIFIGFDVPQVHFQALLSIQHRALEAINHSQQHDLDSRFQPKPYAIATNNLHLTLAFLGHLNTEQISALIDAVSSMPTIAFSQRLTQLAYWQGPNIVCLTGETCAHLQQMHAAMSCIINTHNLPESSHPYQAHISLLRGVKTAQATSLTSINIEPVLYQPKQLILYQSQISPISKRPNYTPIACWPLA